MLFFIFMKVYSLEKVGFNIGFQIHVFIILTFFTYEELNINGIFHILKVPEPPGEDHLPNPAILPSLPDEVELAAMALRAIDNTEEYQIEDDFMNVVTSGHRVLPQDKHEDREE